MFIDFSEVHFSYLQSEDKNNLLCRFVMKIKYAYTLAPDKKTGMEWVLNKSGDYYFTMTHMIVFISCCGSIAAILFSSVLSHSVWEFPRFPY